MNSKFKKVISERISKSLKEKKISQTELAQMIQKSRAYVSNITKGRYLPKISELIKIANYIKKPVGYFLGEGDDENIKTSQLEKARKWEKLLGLIENDIKKDFKDDIIHIPLLDNTKLRNSTLEELIDLKKNATEFVYLSKLFINENLRYYNNPNNLVAIRTFIRDYPEFGIYNGDIIIAEPVLDNDIGDNSGKLFGIFYKGDIGIKRVYKEGKQYYFEPMHSNPVIEKTSSNDPNLLIPAKVLFNIHIKMF